MSMTTTSGRRGGGNGNKAAPAQVESPAEQLPEVRRAQMETHLAVYYQALAEVDELRRRLFEAENDLAHSRVELEAAKAQLAEADSRVNRAHLEADLRVREYQAERDQAVTQRAEYEILLMNIWSLLRRSVSNVSGQRLASLPEIDERQEESAPAAEDGSA